MIITGEDQVYNSLTIDVEDYYHVSAFEHLIDCEKWDNYESRVVKNTGILLDMLDQYNVKATFFVLGWVAERFPRVHQAPIIS